MEKKTQVNNKKSLKYLKWTTGKTIRIMNELPHRMKQSIHRHQKNHKYYKKLGN